MGDGQKQMGEEEKPPFLPICTSETIFQILMDIRLD